MEKAVSSDRTNIEIYLSKGVRYANMNELAMRNYVKAINKDPVRPDARVRKIRLLIRHGHAQQALQAIDEMLLACPDVFGGYHLRFLLLLEVGKIAEAEKTISRAMQLFPEDVGFALDKATLLVVQNQYNQALEYLDKIESTLDVNIGDQKSKSCCKRWKRCTLASTIWLPTGKARPMHCKMPTTRLQNLSAADTKVPLRV